MNAECVNIGFHERAKGIVNHAMACQRPCPGEGFGDDRHVEVTTSVLGTSMSGMQVALVLDQEM